LDPELANAFTSYDVNRANQLLDSIGLNRKNSAGKRLLSSGKAFTLIIDVPNYIADWIEIASMLAVYWQAIGLDVTARSIDPNLWGVRIESNDYDISTQTGGDGFLFATPGTIGGETGYNDEGWYTIYQRGHQIYRRTNGEEGVAPDEDIKRLWELGAAAVSEPDETRRNGLIKEIFDIHKKNLYVLGIATMYPYPYTVRNTLHNVPPLNLDWAFGHGGHGMVSQYYME
jgi:peptide/nickel transport system substrate-binding protein